MKAAVLHIGLLFSMIAFSQHPVPGAQHPVNNARFVTGEYGFEKPSAKKPLEIQGEAYGRKQQWKKAAACYKQLIARYPNVADYHYKYGGFLGMMALKNKLRAIGLVDDIKKTFKKAAQLDPTHTGARRALVELYVQLPGILGGSRKKALHYAEALETISKTEGYLAKGYIYEHGNQPEKAEKYYRLALHHPDDVTTLSKHQLHYKIGQLCADYELQLDKGLLHIQKYIRNKTSYYETELHIAYCVMAKLYRLKNQKANAMECIRKALEKTPGFKAALREKAMIETL